MKKNLLALSLFTLLFTPSLLAATENMIVSNMTGTPEIIRNGKTMPVTPGTSCQTGDILKTPTASCQMDMAVNDLVGCRVLPNSECMIVNGASSGMHLQIKSGN